MADRGATPDTLIIGGGINGLTVAHRLMRAGRPVRLVEKADHVGGVITTRARDGFRFEFGPNTVLGGTPAVERLIDEAGLRSRRLEAAPAAKRRYVLKGGRPTALPGGPVDLLRFEILPPAALFKILGEPFRPRGPRAQDETVAEFVRRRLGQTMLDYLVGPFVSGVYAGDPDRLSIRHAVPRIYALERDHGSLIRGALARRHGPAPGKGIFSFPDGLGELPHALGAALGDQLTTGARVAWLRRDGDGYRAGLHVAGGDTTEVRARRVILAVPAAEAARLLAALDDGMDRAAPLRDVPSAPVAVVGLGFRREDVAHPLDGFGLLFPRLEKRRLLGALFVSTLFPGRAPDGHVAISAFAGGATDPGAAALPESELLALVERELSEVLGIRQPPVFRECVRWSDGIPQYNLGHERFLEAATAAEARHPGLRILGNWRSGVSVGDCVTAADRLATELIGG